MLEKKTFALSDVTIFFFNFGSVVKRRKYVARCVYISQRIFYSSSLVARRKVTLTVIRCIVIASSLALPGL